MIEALPDPGTQAGLALYIGLTALLTLLLKWGWDRWRAYRDQVVRRRS